MERRTRRRPPKQQEEQENASPPRRRVRTSNSSPQETSIPIRSPDESPIQVPEHQNQPVEEIQAKEEVNEVNTENLNQNIENSNSQNEENDEQYQVSCRTVSITRIKSGMNVSKFTLEFNEKTIFTGFVKSKIFSSPTITISNTDISQPICTMSVTKNSTFISKTPNGEEIAHIEVIRPGEVSSYPRSWKATTKGNNITHNLYSKPPVLNSEGRYELFFGGKMTTTSVKNCILIDKDEEFEVIGIRKIHKNILEIDGRDDYTDLELFELGIAAFLAD